MNKTNLNVGPGPLDVTFWISACVTYNSSADPVFFFFLGGGGGVAPPPLNNKKNIVFFSNSGPDLLNNYQATEPAFNVGPLSARQRNAI